MDLSRQRFLPHTDMMFTDIFKFLCSNLTDRILSIKSILKRLKATNIIIKFPISIIIKLTLLLFCIATEIDMTNQRIIMMISDPNFFSRKRKFSQSRQQSRKRSVSDIPIPNHPRIQSRKRSVSDIPILNPQSIPNPPPVQQQEIQSYQITDRLLQRNVQTISTFKEFLLSFHNREKVYDLFLLLMSSHQPVPQIVSKTSSQRLLQIKARNDEVSLLEQFMSKLNHSSIDYFLYSINLESFQSSTISYRPSQSLLSGPRQVFISIPNPYFQCVASKLVSSDCRQELPFWYCTIYKQNSSRVYQHQTEYCTKYKDIHRYLDQKVSNASISDATFLLFSNLCSRLSTSQLSPSNFKRFERFICNESFDSIISDLNILIS